VNFGLPSPLGRVPSEREAGEVLTAKRGKPTRIEIEAFSDLLGKNLLQFEPRERG
jgi:hypothetical protein